MEQLGRQDVAAAAAAHHELGPEYSQATIDSFLEKVDSEIAARLDARLGGVPQPRTQTADVATRYERRAVWTGVMIGSAVAGIPFTLVAASVGEVPSRGGCHLARDRCGLPRRLRREPPAQASRP
jgi:hypothetical protein